MPSDLPVLGVTANRHLRGAASANDTNAPHLTLADFEQAFTHRWETDALFVTYSPYGVEKGTPFPRINKTALTSIRQEGYDLVRTVFAVDWDTPEHKPWGETASRVQFESLWVSVCSKFPLAANYSCLYFTKHGARVVYILDDPMPVDESEDMLRWFIYKLRTAGFNCDELCDWTRLFRLPKVIRDGEPTDKDKYFDIEMDLEARLEVSQLDRTGKGDRASVYAELKEFTRPQPPEDEAKALIEVIDKDGKHRFTDWHKQAKRRLQGRECFDAIFNHQRIAQRGERDTTIHRYVGQAVSLLYYMAGTTPEHVYALFLDPVLQLDNEEGEDWLKILWSSVGRLWTKEEAKAQAAKEDEREIEEEEGEARYKALAGMREWCDAHALQGPDDDALLWAEHRFIVSSGQSYYLIGNDGYYRPQAYMPHQVISAIRTHIPNLIPTIVPTVDGEGMREVTLNTIVGRYCTVVDEVFVQPGSKRGYIENIDRTDARLIVPGFSLNPFLRPEYDKDVDNWLMQLFGDEHYEDGCRWIAYALAFDEGATCSLSIMGAQGVGKKLLVQGLAECLSLPYLATDQDIVGSYQYGLLRSPFLVVNEGWSIGNGKHPADSFREISSGDGIAVNRRYRDPVIIKNPVRVIFTANNLDVIKMLCHKRDLSQADREALAIRLMHIDVGRRASDWLRVKGGMDFTAKQGRRWIAPDAGGKSDFIVAKHFMWLYSERHKWKKDARLLVEGRGSQQLMFEMQTQVGSASLVIETILSMLDYRVAQDGLIVTDKAIYVLTSGILHYWRERLSDKIRGETLTTNSIAKVLGGLCLDDSPLPRAIEGYEKQGRRRWYELDVLKMKKAADRHGFRCKRLDEVANFKIGEQK